MKHLVFDVETDGLVSTKIWCICAVDVNTNEEYAFGPDQLQEGYKLLESADKLIGHNIIGFDIPVVEKFGKVKLRDKIIVDTLVLSRLFNPIREGNHGLERWGYELGSPKIDFEEYDRFSNEMLEYCMQDVRLNRLVFDALKKESKGFTKQSVDLEMETYKIISAQREHGFLLDMDAATSLLSELNIKMADVVAQVQERFQPRKETLWLYPKYTKDGKLSKSATTNLGKNTRLSQFEYSQMQAVTKKDSVVKVARSIITDFNLGSRKQIGEYLIEFGWKPKAFTPTGQPQVDEKILSKVDNIPEAKLIADYLMYQKRVAQVESWIKKADPDNRVRGYVNSNGTITGRMTHKDPNLAQVPSTASPYGKDCRACWTVPRGSKLVGIDASGLELRMLAHYMNDEDYTNEVINGDIHTTNQKLAGIESRNKAKTFIYALCYGAGVKRLSEILGGSTSHASSVRESFFNNLPAFTTLTNNVERSSTKGFLKGLDGRKLFVRSKHSALNTLLQGAGAIVMKQALIIFNNALNKEGIDAHFVANVHDEWQVEVDKEHAERVGEIGVAAIVAAGKDLSLNCPLDGEYNVGNNWAETH